MDKSTASNTTSTTPTLTRSDSFGTMGSSNKLILVSNRLPVNAVKDKNTGKWNFSKSSGGLVTAVSGLKCKFLWIGWIGMEVVEEDRADLTSQLLESQGAVPVYISDDIVDAYYNGFSNGTLWPLFHYVEFVYDSKQYKAYEIANQKFAEVIVDLYQPGDLIWVHDYHLMRLPLMLREKLPDANIGFFLHIPFPSSEIYKVLPVRSELIEGMLASDLIGFHTWDYARHFKKACTRILGAESSPKSVSFGEHEVPIGVFPVGIPVQTFEDQMTKPEVITRLANLRAAFGNKRVMIGVDRLDYIKGIPHKLRALEQFFIKYPQWQGKVVLVQIAVPSRTDVEEYRNQKKEVVELVGHINSTYGTLGYQPVNYMYKGVPFNELCALYTLADVALITSLRDGMNLVAHEYVACQNTRIKPSTGAEGSSSSSSAASSIDTPGVLVLSEFAGAAQCLGGAIRVNPHNSKQVADAIHDALSMNDVNRAHRHSISYSFIQQHTAESWGTSFIERMKVVDVNKRLAIDEQNSSLHLLSTEILNNYKNSNGDKKRMILIDYDGVLVPFTPLPALAQPSEKVISVLSALSADPKNLVIIVSGRTRETMIQWFGALSDQLGLCAEHGYFYRAPKSSTSKSANWTSVLPDDPDLGWMRELVPLFEHYQERTPGSVVEVKESSVTWHYRRADPEYGSYQARNLQLHLDNYFGKWPVNVEFGMKCIDVKPYGVEAASVVSKIFSQKDDDLAKEIGYVLRLTRDTADPARIAAILPESVVMVSGLIGKKTVRKVDLSLKDEDEVLNLLQSLNATQTKPVADILQEAASNVASDSVSTSGRASLRTSSSSVTNSSSTTTS